MMDNSPTTKPLIAALTSVLSAGATFIIFTFLIFQQNLAVNGPWNIRLSAEQIWYIAAPMFVVGMVSLFGGYAAARRKTWGLALAGSITSLFPLIIPGIISIVLISLSRIEFK